MSEPKQRHWFLAAVLTVMIIVNGLGAVAFLALSIAGWMNFADQPDMPDMPGWALPVMAIGSVFNVMCALALFSWKRWGFWGACISALLALAINVQIGIAGPVAFLGLAGPILLFLVLQVGGSKKGWPQLEEDRHGILTAFLMVVILGGSLCAIVTLAESEAVEETHQGTPWVPPLMALLTVLIVIGAVALLDRERWGFILAVACSLIALAVNLLIGEVGPVTFIAVVVPVLLFAALRIGGERKGASQLE